MSQVQLLGRYQGLVAVMKPSGLRIHPGAKDGQDDLSSQLKRTPGLAELAPVHRLDAEVSGVVLCAGPELRAEACNWFAKRQVKKTYLALVFGRTHAKGIIRTPLEDARRGETLDALTRYTVSAWMGGFTLLKVRPETGRKHQIRRHLASIGHPLVGDDRYGDGVFRRVPAFPGRIWLHAWKLTLPDGAEVEAPLPPELDAHLDHLSHSTLSGVQIPGFRARD